MAKVRIRRALPKDAGEIAPLLAQLGYSCTEETVRSNVEAISRSEADALIVAESDRTLVGLAHMHTALMIHEPVRVARVVALVVGSDSRRQGIGRALMASLEELAVGAGCSAVEMTSSTHRDAAHAFYESLGYKEKSKRFVKELTQETSA